MLQGVAIISQSSIIINSVAVISQSSIIINSVAVMSLSSIILLYCHHFLLQVGVHGLFS